MLVRGNATNQMCFEAKPELYDELREIVLGQTDKVHAQFIQGNLQSHEKEFLVGVYHHLREALDEATVYPFHTIIERFRIWQGLRHRMGSLRSRLTTTLNNQRYRSKTQKLPELYSDAFMTLVEEVRASLEQPVDHMIWFEVQHPVRMAEREHTNGS